MSSGKFKQLKLYLQALPEALPLVDTADEDAKINRLLTFSIDEEWAQGPRCWGRRCRKSGDRGRVAAISA
jgi:hypothetical protein